VRSDTARLQFRTTQPTSTRRQQRLLDQTPMHMPANVFGSPHPARARFLVPTRRSYKGRVNSRTLDQPEQHLRVDHVVVGKAGIAATGDLAPICTGTVVLPQPAEPMLLLCPVPDPGRVHRLIFGKPGDLSPQLTWCANRLGGHNHERRAASSPVGHQRPKLRTTCPIIRRSESSTLG